MTLGFVVKSARRCSVKSKKIVDLVGIGFMEQCSGAMGLAIH